MTILERSLSTTCVMLALFALAPSPARAELLASGQIELIPSASIEFATSAASMTFDLDSSVGLAGVVGYRAKWFSVGLAPRFVPRLAIALDDSKKFSEADLGVQLAGRYPISAGLELVGFVTPAYSLLHDTSEGGDHHDAAGPTITVGAGAQYRVAPRIQIGATLSYTHGAQRDDEKLAASRLTSLGLVVDVR